MLLEALEVAWTLAGTVKAKVKYPAKWAIATDKRSSLWILVPQERMTTFISRRVQVVEFKDPITLEKPRSRAVQRESWSTSRTPTKKWQLRKLSQQRIKSRTAFERCSTKFRKSLKTRKSISWRTNYDRLTWRFPIRKRLSSKSPNSSPNPSLKFNTSPPKSESSTSSARSSCSLFSKRERSEVVRPRLWMNNYSLQRKN